MTKEEWIQNAADLLAKAHGDYFEDCPKNEQDNLMEWAAGLYETFVEEEQDTPYTPKEAVEEEISCA